MNFDQGEFDFNAAGDAAGYRRWREELDERRRAFESRWGVVLGKPVCVWLRDHAKPLKGKLVWLDDPKRPRHLPPVFRLRGVDFSPGEIESMVQDDGAE